MRLHCATRGLFYRQIAVVGIRAQAGLELSTFEVADDKLLRLPLNDRRLAGLGNAFDLGFDGWFGSWFPGRFGSCFNRRAGDFFGAALTATLAATLAAGLATRFAGAALEGLLLGDVAMEFSP